jgi:hypothetical protein
LEAEQETIADFLAASKSRLTELIEQAYQQVGGHYADLSPGERRHSATQDADELIRDLTEGTAHLPVLPSPAVVAEVLQMVSALEALFVAYVQEAPGAHPDLRREVIRRMQLSTNRFRMKLSAQHLGAEQQALASPRSDPSGSSS